MLDSFHFYPLYANYPAFAGWNQFSESQFMDDMNYLQQMYPAYAKQLQIKINDILNTLDYEGSLIYDQYPDKLQLDGLIQSTLTSLMVDSPELKEKETDWLRDLLSVLFFHELLKRRHKLQNKYFI